MLTFQLTLRFLFKFSSCCYNSCTSITSFFVLITKKSPRESGAQSKTWWIMGPPCTFLHLITGFCLRQGSNSWRAPTHITTCALTTRPKPLGPVFPEVRFYVLRCFLPYGNRTTLNGCCKHKFYEINKYTCPVKLRHLSVFDLSQVCLSWQKCVWLRSMYGPTGYKLKA